MSKNFERFLATASRTTPALRPSQPAIAHSLTAWGRFLATASRTTPALAPSTSKIKPLASNTTEIADAAILELKRTKREKFVFATLLLSLTNFSLIVITALAAFRIDQMGVQQRFDLLFGDPRQLGAFGVLATATAGVVVGVVTAVMARSITKAAYSRPKLSEDGIKLKQPAFNSYVLEQIRSFSLNDHDTHQQLVRRVYVNRKGILYELTRKDHKVLIVEKASDGEVLSIGKGRMSGRNIKVTFKVIDGSETRADLNFTGEDEKELEGTFNNVTYKELINGNMICLA